MPDKHSNMGTVTANQDRERWAGPPPWLVVNVIGWFTSGLLIGHWWWT